MFSNSSTLAEGYLSQAHIDIAKGDFDTAKLMAEAAIEVNPRYFEAFNTLGICFIKGGDCIRALACFDISLQIQPNQPEANSNKAVALEILGEALGLKPIDPAYMPLGCAIFVEEDNKND